MGAAMDEELDTSWFDLKKYEGLNKLDLSGWYTQLLKYLCIQYDNEYQDLEELVIKWTEEIKNSLVHSF